MPGQAADHHALALAPVPTSFIVAARVAGSTDPRSAHRAGQPQARAFSV